MKRDYRWLWEQPPPLPRRWPLLLDLGLLIGVLLLIALSVHLGLMVRS